MKWLNSILAFFKSDLAKKIYALAFRLLKMTAKDVSPTVLKLILDEARTEIAKAEATGKSGSEKRKMVLEALKSKFAGIKAQLFNRVIENALAIFEEERG